MARRFFAFLIIVVMTAHRGMADNVTFISTTEQSPWEVQPVASVASGDLSPTNQTISINPAIKYQTIDGFGGCFNELGWEALLTLPAEKRQTVMESLFDSKTGCGFEFGRMPIGASDFASSWYSLDETPGDYGMEDFSIQRDEGCLIPYIKSALAVNPHLKIWGSAWSPPTWMKENDAYCGGTNDMRFEPKVLDAYALYLARYVEEYQKAGVPVFAVHVQNEPASAQVFPSCLWTGPQIRDFVRDYLGPIFHERHVKAQIWLGTINNGDINAYAVPVLTDAKAARYITGVGYQWDGKKAITETHERFPGFKLMQTETECGGGENNWSSAVHTWGLLKHYLSNWADSYMYWNMVLDQKSTSTWGWKQNAMITVNTSTHEVIYHPEFYLMKHFSAFVALGAKRIESSDPNSLAFRNRDGSIVLVTSNPTPASIPIEIQFPHRTISIVLPANSFDTIIQN
jgi:glucosylceramidase